MTGKVYLVGAGPGDPELLTRKAFRLLETADVVLHDDLVSPEILALISPGASVCNVGKRCGQKSFTQEEIHELMLLNARLGRAVVRLKGGDPLIFSRIAEEMEALREARIPFEIVPGVTAASAAAAASRIPLTARSAASKLVFLTAHCRGAAPRLDWPDTLSPDTTVVVYMPGRRYAEIADKLIRSGLAGNTPSLLISRASTDQEGIVKTTLQELPKIAEQPAPAVLIAGPVAAAPSAAGRHPAVEQRNPVNSHGRRPPLQEWRRALLVFAESWYG